MGDALLPAQITEAFDHEPTAAQTKGEMLVGKKTGTSRIANSGMWRLEATKQEPADLNAQIAEILSKLTPDLDVWRSITSVYTTDLFCGLFMDDMNEGLEISLASLAALSSRGIKLSLDIYSGPDASAA
jgi:hypothetical protein